MAVGNGLRLTPTGEDDPRLDTSRRGIADARVPTEAIALAGRRATPAPRSEDLA